MYGISVLLVSRVKFKKKKNNLAKSIDFYSWLHEEKQILFPYCMNP